MNSYDIFSNYLRMVYCLIVNMQSRNRIIKKVVSVVLFFVLFCFKFLGQNLWYKWKLYSMTCEK